MIKFIDGMCRTWGAQCAARDFGAGQGYAHRSTTENVREVRLSPRAPEWFRKRPFTAKGLQDFVVRPAQFSDEGHTGDGLLIARALRPATEELRVLAYAHYVIMVEPDEGSPQQYKADQLGIKLSEYWRTLDRLHYFILGRLPDRDAEHLTVSTAQPKFRGNSDTVAKVSQGPAVNLAALNRRTLTLK